MAEIVDKCECCGRPGMPIGGYVGMRCVLHAHVVDADDWLRALSKMAFAFETEEEFTAYVRREYGAGLDMMQGLLRDPDESDPVMEH